MIGHTFPEQRVSQAEKTKDAWMVNNMHYWTSMAIGMNDKLATALNLEYANGHIDEETYKYVLNPLSAEADVTKNLPGIIRKVDFLTPIKEKNIGEYISLTHNFNVKVNDPDIVLQQNGDIQAKVYPIIQEQVLSKIAQMQEAEATPPEQQIDARQVPPVDIAAEIEKAKKEWFDKRAIKNEKLLNYLNDKNRFTEERYSAFHDWWATEEVFWHVYINNGNTIYEKLNPVEVYPIHNGAERVQDSDGVLIKRKTTWFKAELDYADELTNKDREYLQVVYSKLSDGIGEIGVDVILDTYGRKVMIDNESAHRSDTLDINITIPEYILYFKTEVKKKFVTRINQIGVVTNTLVPDEYELNPEIGDIEIETKWIQETWEQVLLGEYYSGIYLKPRAIAAQVYDDNNNSAIPVIGRDGILENINKNPIPKRIIPNLALFMIITLQIERTMAKFKGSREIIPMSMMGLDKKSRQDNMFYLMADNTLLYDDAKVPFNTAAQGYRVVGNDAISNYLRTLIDLRDLIKAEAWDMANMNDSRYGEAAPSSAVTNNQQNIFRAKLGSVLMTTIFNSTVKDLYQMVLEYAKLTDSDTVGSYFREDGEVIHFNMNGADFTEATLGVFVSDAVIDEEKLKQYRDLAFSAGQNGELELAAKAINSNNATEIGKHIDEFMAAKREFEQQVEDNKMQMAQLQSEDRDKDRQHKLKEIELKETMAKDRELAVAGVNNENTTNNK